MKKLFLTMLLAAFLVSCDELLDLADLLDDNTPLEANQFYAVDFTKEKFYKINAEMLYEGKKCLIWAEKDSGITKKKAEEIAAKYDNDIRPKIVGAFGMKNIIDKDGTFDDILDYANWLADKDNKKLTILLLDIKDDFKNLTDSYVAGYFYSNNFYPRNQNNSNGCDMIFVDTYPGLKLAEEQTYATFAHELQHLINYATTTLKRRDSNSKLMLTDTWVDEGLSSQAEHIYYDGISFADKDKIFDGYIKEHCKRFSKDEKGTIAKGNNFFVWNNHTEEPMAILDEYSTVYLFFRWLYLQADSGLRSSIFLNIETSNFSDHRVITNVAKNINPEWANWDTLLSSWLAANYYPGNTNYGYKDSYFSTGENKISVKPLTKTSTPLYPGEGVYSIINKSFTPKATGHIRYGGLSSNSSSNIVTQTTYNSGVLLTYNANTDNESTTETGYLTGVSASVSSDPNSRTAIEDAQTAHTGPYAIDARDISRILGRNK